MTKKIKVDLKVTVAFVLDGAIVRPGDEISVDNALAKNLLHRGRVVLATADEAPAEKPKASRKAKAKTDDAPVDEAEAPAGE